MVTLQNVIISSYAFHGSDAELDVDSFVFADKGEAEAGGFSDVSGLGTEITVAEYRSGGTHTPDWTDLNDSDPGAASGSTLSDPEWRYVPVRRMADDGEDGDMGFHWGDDSLL